jgi:hypothetical protein
MNMMQPLLLGYAINIPRILCRQQKVQTDVSTFYVSHRNEFLEAATSKGLTSIGKVTITVNPAAGSSGSAVHAID